VVNHGGERIADVADQLGGSGARHALGPGFFRGVGQDLDVERPRRLLDADHLANHVVLTDAELGGGEVRDRLVLCIEDGGEDRLLDGLRARGHAWDQGKKGSNGNQDQRCT